MTDSNLVLAEKLASMTSTAGDLEIRGQIMTVPIRDLDGTLAVLDYDVRGLAARVEELKADAIVAVGNDRGGQHAALALIANSITEDHPGWDSSIDEDTGVYDTIGEFEPTVIDIENFAVSNQERYP
ncbi:hypothetical protein BSP239C_01278 [Brevibacterium sp. 239c]|uniref:hypothetical protein n=1 Tax=Brevibacterium sp. 239c TaxID=1965356 RepID=UPI000C675634|nr:hypothetical protein [Brevibacterium sp. 239c]SMX79749.1 hypothetical protein BSP239C_01278 [Brevibacterium sp. 239c]